MRIVVIADTHISASAAPDYKHLYVNWMLVGRAADISKALVKEINGLRPDFVLHAGDITDQGDDKSFILAAAIFKDLEAPFRFTVGAHDTYRSGARERLAQAFGYANFSETSTRFDFKDWRVIFLDSSWWLKKDGSEHEFLDFNEYRTGKYAGVTVPRREMIRLSNELESSRQKPVILLTHHRVARKDKRCYEGMHYPKDPNTPDHPTPYDTCFKNSDIVLGIIEKHENVKMVITGHAHMNELILRKGKLFCTVAGACVYPMDYKVIDLSDGKIWVTTRPFPDSDVVKESFAGNEWPIGHPNDRSRIFNVKQPLNKEPECR